MVFYMKSKLFFNHIGTSSLDSYVYNKNKLEAKIKKSNIPIKLQKNIILKLLELTQAIRLQIIQIEKIIERKNKDLAEIADLFFLITKKPKIKEMTTTGICE